MQTKALLGMGGGLVPFSCNGLPPGQLGGWGSAACSWHGWQAASPLCGLPLQKKGRSWDASCGMQVVVRFGLDLSAILCMETNPNQPLLACLVSFVLLPFVSHSCWVGLGCLQFVPPSHPLRCVYFFDWPKCH